LAVTVDVLFFTPLAFSSQLLFWADEERAAEKMARRNKGFFIRIELIFNCSENILFFIE
jgi:hypothetical protein